ncbi:hypothetical protein [Bacillus sp. FSL R12-0074]|uniref:hypothetical protein n=1 Tax=Bacillus sp. FSL R12-0074 TaxID=2954664 RepID=UPI0030FA1C35
MDSNTLKKCVVKRAFRDKFTDVHYSIGDSYESNDVKRIIFLQDEGFLNEGSVEEIDKEVNELTHVGGGYYQLPNGEKVKGKDAALKSLNELNKLGE